MYNYKFKHCILQIDILCKNKGGKIMELSTAIQPTKFNWQCHKIQK